MANRAIILSSLLLIAGVARGQTTRPADAGGWALELVATNALNRGDFAEALPMFEKLLEQSTRPDQADRYREQIRACQRMLGNIASAGGPAATAEGRRTPHPVPKSGQILEISIKELGNFNYDPDRGGIPADVLRLSGTKVRLRGFMIPIDQAEHITSFSLVPDLFACCFGQPPQIQHMVTANCPPGKAVGYFSDELVVEGTLKVGEQRDDGFVVSLFQLDVSSVRPAPK